MEPTTLRRTMDNTTGIVAMAVGMNMQTMADEQILAAQQHGVALDVKTEVYVNDGSKSWPSTLAYSLCDNPRLAQGTRQDMADLITKSLTLDKPFNPTRLSRALSSKAKSLVSDILRRFGYNPAKLDTGMDIRDTVKSGDAIVDDTESTIRTKFQTDGVFLAGKWYPYERVNSYETEMPWYCLGIRFAGCVIPLKTVLAMRGVGIGQFIELDEAARKRASADQVARRVALNTSWSFYSIESSIFKLKSRE
jgi:hypothetical protein